MNSLYIIIPAYNEAESINNIIEEWYPVIEAHNGDGESRLVIIDDGSKDDTYSIALKACEDKPLAEIHTKPNGGHGAAIYYGYAYALNKGADYIFQTDSDGQTLASEFEAFWEERETVDAIIGSRINRADGLARRIVSIFVRLTLYLTFHVAAEDVNTPYRLMRQDALRAALSHIPEGYNLTNIALTGLLLKNNTVKFLPITFRSRQAGTNSINIPKIMKMGVKALGELANISRS